MKLEIYQVGKLPPLTVVECDDWVTEFDLVPRLKCYGIKKDKLRGDKKRIIAMFFINNIAGFKEMVGEDDG